MRQKTKPLVVKRVSIRFLLIFALLVLAVPKVVVAEPAMWRVDGREGTLYLFGTIHVLPSGTNWLSPRLADIFDTSDRVVLEVAFAQADEYALSFLAQTTEVFSSSIPLKTRLEEEMYARLKARMAAFGIEEAQFNRYQPWYAGVILSQLGNEEAGHFNWFGVDSRLQIRAEAGDKKLISLETTTRQVMFYADLPLDTQINYLAGVLDGASDNATRLQLQLDAWIEGDIETTEQMALTPLMANRERYQVFIKNRNEAWLPTLEDLLNLPGQHFIAVGTAHLIGPDGLIKLLKEKGYTAVRQ